MGLGVLLAAACFGYCVGRLHAFLSARPAARRPPDDVFVVVEERMSKCPAVTAFASYSDAQAHLDDMAGWFPGPRKCEVFVVPLED